MPSVFFHALPARIDPTPIMAFNPKKQAGSPPPTRQWPHDTRERLPASEGVPANTDMHQKIASARHRISMLLAAGLATASTIDGRRRPSSEKTATEKRDGAVPENPGECRRVRQMALAFLEARHLRVKREAE